MTVQMRNAVADELLNSLRARVHAHNARTYASYIGALPKKNQNLKASRTPRQKKVIFVTFCLLQIGSVD